MSLATDVFSCEPGYYWVYYPITKPNDVGIALAQPKPVVLMYWASWNQPSKLMMKPFFDLADAKRKEAVFCRVDVDKCKEIAAEHRVEALPTFLLFKEGIEKARVVGAKVQELNNIIKASK